MRITKDCIYDGVHETQLSFTEIRSGSKPFNNGVNNKDTTNDKEQHVPYCKTTTKNVTNLEVVHINSSDLMKNVSIEY